MNSFLNEHNLGHIPIANASNIAHHCLKRMSVLCKISAELMRK